ncbi:DUF1015 family protein [Actinophytocola sp.]|uniref:DUF1015 family protein n=1 Tax=Actinophytocola sp. TaxID=1872138 RepID=UPI002D80F4EE|nr:DUF1015 family protein [Actinophytocola sp.]HET9140921.1 DUF1015 family protein [Actinophytocola sp.]
MSWVRAIRSGWVLRGEVPGPDVDEFAEPERVVAALARGNGRTLLAVQHPHRTPAALAEGLTLDQALPAARATLSVLRRTAYRQADNIVAPYLVDGPDGSVAGVLCMVGLDGVAHVEEVYPQVVAERAAVISGLGCLTSAAMLVPVRDGDRLTAAVLGAIETAGPPDVSTVDSGGRRHRVWVNGDADLLEVAGAAPLLVADGNHRVAAALEAGLDGLLGLVTAGPRLRIGAFHRVLVGTGLGAAALTRAWQDVGLTVRRAAEEPARGRVAVDCAGTTLVVELPDTTAFDHEVVESLLVHRALGLDPEGPHLRPLPAGRPVPDDADAVLRIAPVPMADVLATHAAGGRMPRKSTFFTPKPRSGLVLADLP